MMKIHTTQNLNSLVIKERSTNNLTSLPNEIRYNFLENNLSYKMARSAEANSSTIAFKGNKPDAKNVKKFIEVMTKVVGEMSKSASPEVKRGDKILKSPFFNKLLNVVDYETVVQSTIAALACALRALTIVGMSNEENKGNNTYAAGHALASGVVGFVTVFALTTPFKAGSDHVMKKMFKNLKESTLKRLHPHLNLDSIKDASGNRLDKELWKDIYGNSFSDEIKNCDMLPKFKHISEISEETFEKILKIVGVDWKSMKGKSFNDVKVGNKSLADVIDFEHLGLKIKHVEKSTVTGKEVETKAQILFKDMKKSYLEDLIKNAEEGSNWKNLDINSVFDGNKMRHFREWKTLDGKKWKIDLDSVFVSSALETADYMPRISGEMRIDKAEGIHKFRTYQRNGKDGALGTEITDEMLKADKENAGLIKSLTWLPDLLFRVPIAMTTIALIPWILKTVFHVEKQQKPAPVETAQVAAQVVSPAFKGNEQKIKNVKDISFRGKNNEPKPEANNEVSFKGGETSFMSWIGKKMANLYGRPLIESETMARVSAKLSNVPGGLTQAMATLGALLTSATYVGRTLNNKKLEDDKRNTLAINQVLCWVVPTIASYTVDKLLNNWVKKQEYRYSGLQQQLAEKARLDGNPEEAKKIIESLSKKVKGVRALASLAVFTIIYRYATPVLITPVANKIGDSVNAKRAAKKAELAATQVA